MIDGAGEILARAREILETRGWVQGHYVTDDGVCLVYALNEAGRELHDTRPHAYRMISYKVNGGNIIGWNDTPGRTYEEVIQLLKEAEREATQ